MKDLEDIIRATDRILNKLTKKQKLQKTNKNWIMAVDEYNFIVSVDGHNNYMFWQRVRPGFKAMAENLTVVSSGPVLSCSEAAPKS